MGNFQSNDKQSHYTDKDIESHIKSIFISNKSNEQNEKKTYKNTLLSASSESSLGWENTVANSIVDNAKTIESFDEGLLDSQSSINMNGGGFIDSIKNIFGAQNDPSETSTSIPEGGEMLSDTSPLEKMEGGGIFDSIKNIFTANEDNNKTSSFIPNNMNSNTETSINLNNRYNKYTMTPILNKVNNGENINEYLNEIDTATNDNNIDDIYKNISSDLDTEFDRMKKWLEDNTKQQGGANHSSDNESVSESESESESDDATSYHSENSRESGNFEQTSNSYSEVIESYSTDDSRYSNRHPHSSNRF